MPPKDKTTFSAKPIEKIVGAERGVSQDQRLVEKQNETIISTADQSHKESTKTGTGNKVFPLKLTPEEYKYIIQQRDQKEISSTDWLQFRSKENPNHQDDRHQNGYHNFQYSQQPQQSCYQPNPNTVTADRFQIDGQWSPMQSTGAPMPNLMQSNSLPALPHVPQIQFWENKLHLKPPTFSGDKRTAADFLSQFNIYRKQSNIATDTDLKDLLTYCLRERALLWLKNVLATNKNITGEQVLTKFEAYFINTISQDLLRKELRNAIFKIGDNLEEHIDMLTQLWFNMKITDETVQVNDLLDSIRDPDLALYVKSTKTDTVEDCITSMKTYLVHHNMKTKVTAVDIEDPNSRHSDSDNVQRHTRGRSKERHRPDKYRKNRRESPKWSRSRSNNQSRSAERKRDRRQSRSRERKYEDRCNYSYRNRTNQCRDNRDIGYDSRRNYNQRSHSRDRDRHRNDTRYFKYRNRSDSRDTRNSYRNPSNEQSCYNTEAFRYSKQESIHPDQCGFCLGWGHHMVTCSSRFQGNLESMTQD